MFAIQVKDRKRPVRNLIKQHNAASKAAYALVARHFHEHMTPARFTYSHGKEAGYEPRKGDTAPYGSKDYWRSYAGRKKKQKGHRDPLVWEGRSRTEARRTTITSTSKQARLKYRIRAFTWHPKYKAEFVKILPRELIQLGQVYDKAYDKLFNPPF